MKLPRRPNSVMDHVKGREMFVCFIGTLSADQIRAQMLSDPDFVQQLHQCRDLLPMPLRRNLEHIMANTPTDPTNCGEDAASSGRAFCLEEEAIGSAPGLRQRHKRLDKELYYSSAELNQIDQAGAFCIPSQEDYDRVFTKCASELATADQNPCAVCELAFHPADTESVELSSSLLQNLRLLLGQPPGSNIPAFLVSQYDASHVDPDLKDLLLYPPGVSRVDSVTTLIICSDCAQSLNKGHLPRLAIANGNWIGRFPLGVLPWIEEQLLALVSPCVSVKTVTGGSLRCLRSHHYIVKNTAGPILEMLPHVAASRIRVTMVGAMTPQQIAVCRARHTIDVPRAKAALKFLMDHHKSYPSRFSDQCATLASVEDRLTDVVEDCTESSNNPVRGAVVERIDDTSSYAVASVNECPDPQGETEWVEENSIILDQAEQTDDYLIRQSTAFVTTHQWADCIDMFPTLFPGGCGGPRETRRKPLSVTAWTRRVLRLHGCLFQRHDVFLLLAFDFLALENARNRMFFRLKATRDAVRAGSVTREAIAECVNYRQHLIRSQAIGVIPDPPSDTIRQIINIQKGVEASEVAYYGSNRSRAKARSDLFGYIRRFGPLHVFFTISPDASGVYSIGIQSGVVHAKAVHAANAHLLPTKTERRRIATRHPVECARYFIRVMEVIVKNVLGWDKEHQLPYRGGGLFGIVKAFTGSTETQVSGDLHAHFVVWLHGLPSTGSAMEAKLHEDSNFVERFQKLIDTASTLTIPGLHPTCPLCDGCLVSLSIPLRAYQRQKKNGVDPVETSRCSSCNQSFKSHDLLNHVISRNGEPSPTDKDFILCADPSQHQWPSDHYLPVILREVQTHYWHHTTSCFKVTKKTPSAAVCRFLRPANAYLGNTRVDANLEIHKHRPIGCEYLNAYNLVLAGLFRCNHDVRFIINGSSRDIAAYICKYIMKPQNRIENDLAFRLGVMERVTNRVDSRNRGSNLSDRERGNKILSGLMYAMTNRQEMPATMAALLVLRASPFWISHPVVSLNIRQLLITLDENDEDEEDVSIPLRGLDQEAPVFYKPNTLRAYWNRPSEMELLSLVEVVEQFSFNRSKYIQDRLWKVVSLRGEKLINIELCRDEDEREKYYRIMNLLFKPHRQYTLSRPGCSFEDAYNEFLRSGPSHAVSIALNYTINIQDSYRATSAAEDPSPEELLLSHHSSLTGLNSSYDESDQGLDDVSDDDTIPDHFDLIHTIPDITAEHRLCRYDNEFENEPVLANTITQFAFQASGHHIALASGDISNPLEEPSTGTTRFLELYTTLPTRLEKLLECFSPVPWVDPATAFRQSKHALPPFSKIADISLAFELNPWQHYAFETTARHVLYEYLKDIEVAAGERFPRPPHNALKEQFIGYMGGEAGSGMSAVIHALLTFARSWERVGSIETLAFTGVAAININGRTIHSSRNLPIFAGDERRPSSEMSAKFAKVVLSIIDELSMTDQRLLGRADTATRQMRTQRNSVWAGCHLLFSGDWKQIPPVGGTAAYRPDSSNSDAALGYEVYKSINFVVFLTDNMRSRMDPVYTAILRRMRWGKLTDDDIATLNTRVGAVWSNNDSTKGFFRPIVAATNAVRCAVNYKTILEAGRTGQVQLFEAVAKSSAASTRNFLKFSDFDDHLTGRIPLKLLYFIGMPIIITHRVTDPALQDILANGTIGHIIGHELRTTAFEIYSVDGVSVFRHPILPLRLLIKVKDCDEVLYQDLPSGVVPVEPLHAKIEVSVPLRSGTKRKRSNPHMTVDQFPMVPAFACTPEKLQGQTCKDGIVISSLDRGSKSISPQALYVSFSRTTSLAKLSIMHPISRDDVHRFKPTASTVREMQRLQNMIVVPSYFNSKIVQDFKSWLSTQRVE